MSSGCLTPRPPRAESWSASLRSPKELRMPRPILLVLSLLALLVSPVAAQEATPEANPVAAQAGGLTVVASGLTNPRGFLWAPDGTLYVAEAGSGGESFGTP